MVLLALFLAAVGWLWLTHDVGLSVSDEGYVVAAGMRVLRGDMVGRDFHDPWSFIAYVVAVWFLFFGEDLVAFRQLMVLFKATSAVLLYGASLRAMPAPWALLPYLATCLLSGPIFKAYTGTAFALALWGVMRYLEQPGASRARQFGACMGLAFLLRPEVTAMLMVLFTVLPVVCCRRISRPVTDALEALVVFSGVLLLALFLVLMISHPCEVLRKYPWETYLSVSGLDSLDRERLAQVPWRDWMSLPALFVYDHFINVQGGFLGSPAAVPHELHQQAVAMPLELLLTTLEFTVPLLLISFLVVEWNCIDAVLLAVLLASMTKYLARSDLSHLLQGLPLMSVVLARVLSRLASGGCADKSRVGLAAAFLARLDRWRPLAAAAGVGLALALLAGSLASTDIYSGGVGILRKAEHRLSLPAAHIWLDRERAWMFERLAQTVERRLKPGTSVFVGPNCPILYLMLGQQPHILLTFGHSFEPEAELSERVGSRIEILRNRVSQYSIELLILDQHYVAGMETEPRPEYFTALFRRLALGFEKVEEAGRFVVFARRKPPTPARR